MTLDVLGVGNAIVDVFAELDLDLASSFGLKQGSMTLVDDATSDQLTSWAGWARGSSGGSAANTTVGVVSLGGTAGFVGRVAADPIGELFCEDLRSVGVVFEPRRPLGAGPAPQATSHHSVSHHAATGRCLVLVAPDGERTMATYLGAANLIEREDLDPTLFASARVVYLEGYLSDAPCGYEVLRRSADLANEASAELALSLSDPFCVERHRPLFLELAERADLVFANEAEASLLAGVPELDAALDVLATSAGTRVVTLGPRGAVVLRGGERIAAEAALVERVVDTTGAGDLYAAGFLYGWTRGADPETCAKLGSVAAGEIVAQLGARPRRPLSDLAPAAVAAPAAARTTDGGS